MHPAFRKEPLFYKKTLPVFHFFLQKTISHFFSKNTPIFHFFTKHPHFPLLLQKNTPHFISAYGPVLTLTSSLII